jgi:hypothetical protein
MPPVRDPPPLCGRKYLAGDGSVLSSFRSPVRGAGLVRRGEVASDPQIVALGRLENPLEYCRPAVYNRPSVYAQPGSGRLAGALQPGVAGAIMRIGSRSQVEGDKRIVSKLSTGISLCTEGTNSYTHFSLYSGQDLGKDDTGA